MNEIKSTILAIEDDPQIARMLKVTLQAEGYKFEHADSGAMGVRMAASVKPDLVLLDLGLPDMDGTEALEAIRGWSQVPVMVVSVRHEDSTITKALDLGADDYVTKPFSVEILFARIRANLRKAAREEAGEPVLTVGPLTMDLVRHEVKLEGEIMKLSPREYELLRYLMTHAGKMLSHSQILTEVWGPAHKDDTQYLRVYIGQLRQKFTDTPAEELILTEAGVGYRMDAPAA